MYHILNPLCTWYLHQFSFIVAPLLVVVDCPSWLLFIRVCKQVSSVDVSVWLYFAAWFKYIYMISLY